MPIAGWSTTGGDLRIPHFLGLHALQLIPLLALGLARFRVGSDQNRIRLVRVAAGGYAGLMALLTWQALRGQPVTSPDRLTVLAFAALAVVIAGLLLMAHLNRARPDVKPTGADQPGAGQGADRGGSHRAGTVQASAVQAAVQAGETQPGVYQPDVDQAGAARIAQTGEPQPADSSRS